MHNLCKNIALPISMNDLKYVTDVHNFCYGRTCANCNVSSDWQIRLLSEYLSQNLFLSKFKVRTFQINIKNWGVWRKYSLKFSLKEGP